MSSWKTALMVLSFMFVSATAQAAFMVEPHIGYESGSSETEYKVSGLKTSADSDVSGMTYGARVGYSMLGFMGGLDFQQGTITDENDNDIDVTDLGVYGGYALPMLLRAYAGYNLSADAVMDINNTEVTFSGSAIKLGLGYTGLPFVSLNAEYIMRSYDDMDLDNTSDVDSSIDVYRIGLSLPYSL